MIAIERLDGVVRLKLSAPPLNILSRSVLLELRDALDCLRDDHTVRVVLLTADGKHFSAGASVEEHLPPVYPEMIEEFAETVSALYEFPLPVMAVVQGRCLGGAFEVVQAADLIIAGESAQFGQPEIVLGVFPPAACALLADRVGASRAAEILFTGDPLSASEAHAAGLAARVMPDDRLHEQALALAQRIARHSGAALRSLKRALRLSAASWDARARINAASRVYTDELMGTHDALEGLNAFLAKRRPEWSHS